MVNNKGKHRKGTVILKDKDGTWAIERQNVKTPCAGMSAPLVIESVSGSGVRDRQVPVAEGLQGHHSHPERVDDTTLQGELDDGRTLTLTREQAFGMR